MPEEALTSFTVCDAYRYFASAQLLTSKSGSRTEYLMIMFIDHHMVANSNNSNIIIITIILLLIMIILGAVLKSKNIIIS